MTSNYADPVECYRGDSRADPDTSIANDTTGPEEVEDEILQYHYSTPSDGHKEISMAVRDSLALQSSTTGGEPHYSREDSDALDHSPPGEVDARKRRRRLQMAMFLALVLVVVLSTVLTRKNRDSGSGAEFVETSGVTAAEDSEPEIFPTASPTSELETTLEYLVLSPFIENPKLLLDPSTPQGKAFEQILSEGRTDEFRIKQRAALMIVYFSTGGENWDWNHGWETFEENECSWYGVLICRYHESDQGSSVSNLSFVANNLIGTIPSEICMLTEMENILVQNNELEGELPSCLTSLPALEELDVHHNNLSGPIPPGFLTISTLEILTLSNNNFSGNLDPLFEGGGIFPAFDKLETLNLHNNDFDGSVPAQFFFLKKLETLSLHGNSLTGNLNCQRVLPVMTVDCEVTCGCCTACF